MTTSNFVDSADKADFDRNEAQERILHLPSSAESAYRARRFVSDFAQKLGFDREGIGDIEVAVGEAMTNAIEHGQWDDRPIGGAENDIFITLRTVDRKLIIEIRDQGPGFTPGTVRSTGSEDVYAVRGRGIGIIMALMDDFSLERTQNGMTVRMTRVIPG